MKTLKHSHHMHSTRRRRRSSIIHWWLSFLTVIGCQFITPLTAASKHDNFQSAMLRRRKMQNGNVVMTIPPFALDFGYIITDVTDTSLLLDDDQQIHIEIVIQSALNDFLNTETTSSSSSGAITYTSVSITSVQYTSTKFLPQSTDPNLQQTFCLTPTDCTTQREILGATNSIEGDYPFKGCFRRKDNFDTVLFGTGGSLEEMMDVELNDNLERVFCYKRVDEEEEEVSSDGELDVPDVVLEVERGGDGGSEDGGLNRRRLGEKETSDNDAGGEVHSNRRRLSVQSAIFTVIVTGGQAVLDNSGERPTQSELRESILAQVGANAGSVLAAKVRSLAASYDPTLTPLLGDLNSVLIADDQPSFVEETASGTYLSVLSCEKSWNVPKTECLAKQQTSEMAVHCCSGTLGSDLSCSRRNCLLTDSYDDAEAHCVSLGMRLCSVPELESGACCDKGCGFNNRMTWTSSVCSVGDESTLSPSPPPITFIEETTTTTSPSPPPMTSSPTREPSTTSPTSSPSSNPTPSPTREPSTSPTFSPTRKPSNPPSNSPVTMPITSSPTIGPSDSPITSPATSTPTIPPISSPTSLSPTAQDTNPCPDGECLDINGECKGEVQCFADPCDVNPCEDGEVCTPNYCGGCDWVCSALAISPSPTTTSPNTASPETPRPTYMFGFPTPPPMLSEAPMASPTKSPDLPTYSPTVDPNPPIPPTGVNAAELGPGSDGNNDGQLDTNNSFIIAFALAGSLVVALAIGLGFFALRKHRNHRMFEDKDPAALETTFNQSDFGEDVECYNYDENAEFYPASHVEIKHYEPDQKKSSRFGLVSTFGSASGGKGNKNGDKGGSKNSVVKKDQPLSCQDGNGMNGNVIDDIVDDLALDFLAGTGNSKKSKETKDKGLRDFRPNFMSAVAPFKAFQGEETDSDEVSKRTELEGKTAQDFRPTLMDTSSETFQGADIGESSEFSSKSADPNGTKALELGQKHEEVTAPYSPGDGHLILSDIYKAAKKSRWEREEKSQFSTQVSATTQTLNEKLAKDLRVHRAKMNSFLDDDITPEPEIARGPTKSFKILNPFSLPQRERTPRIIRDDDSAVLKDPSLFAQSVDDDESRGPSQPSNNYQTSITSQKKSFAAPPLFAQRNKIAKNTLQKESETSPDRRFFTFDGDEESNVNEVKSHIPNLIMADDKSGFASAVSSIGQVDWRGRERNDRRARVDRRKKQREPSVDTIETDEAGAKLVACQSALQKTKNILSETLERSRHCKARVVSPTSDINTDDDEGDDDYNFGNQVSRPWKAKWDSGKKGKGPPVVEDVGYQSSNFDPDSDWEFDDNDVTVDYSAEGSFTPSPLKGVGFDLKR